MAELIGLCATCEHARRLPHPRGNGVYWRCLLSDTDRRFPKYPRLPVLECGGYEAEKSEQPG
jgi:hypothetical protein